MDNWIDRWQRIGLNAQAALLSLALGIFMIWFPHGGSTGWMEREYGQVFPYLMAVALLLGGTAYFALSSLPRLQPFALVPVLFYFLLISGAILDGTISPISAVFLIYVAHTILWGMFDG